MVMNSGKWFKADEFKCNCGKCGLNTVHPELIKILDRARDHLGTPLRINSGVRCGPQHTDYNGQIGGAKNSMHLPQGDVRGLLGRGEARWQDKYFPWPR